MKTIDRLFNFLGVFLLLAAVAAPSAAQQSQAPDEVVKDLTTKVLALVEEHRDTYESDPQAFFSAIDNALSDRVNFERMAFLVMDAKYYRASTEAQRNEFVAVFRDSLLQTYSKGLLQVDQAAFEVKPLEAEAGARTVNVKQVLQAGSTSFDLTYSMRQEDNGEWLLVNVVIDGINLGSTFRNQFAQSAIRYQEDLDLVIANWTAGT